MNDEGLTIGIIGKGGDGIITSGEMLVASAATEGLYGFMLKSFGPQIRGGESSCRVRIRNAPILTQGDNIDVLGVFGWKNYKEFAEEFMLRDGVIIFYDQDDPTPEDALPIDATLDRTVYRIPFKKIAQDVAGTTLAKNLVMLGVLAQLYNIPYLGIEKKIRHRFGKKGEKIVESNLYAFQAGRDYAREHIEERPALELDYIKGEPKLVMDGNEAVAYGALFAGCEFFAGYPITPSSEIMEFLLREMPRFDRTVMQVEDEICAINMVIGASFAGKKALTATSGPGISLMNEAIGLATMAELPCVIVDVQRAGPSTGVPTKTEQSDLQQTLFGTHGDAPKVVLAPTDIEDCFSLTVTAFNIAEKYQVPVIILSDQFVGQRKECLNPIDLSRFTIENRLVSTSEELKSGKRFNRFHLTSNGVSKMTYPGIKHGEYLACGLAHDESGNPTSRFQIHNKMNEKRFRKFSRIRQELDLVKCYGPEDAELGIIAWGSSRGVVEEAVLKANNEGLKVSAVVPQILYPIPLEKLKTYFRPLRRLIIVELSYGAQFYYYLRSRFDLPPNSFVYKRSGGMPFTVREIYQQIQQLIGTMGVV